MIDADSELATPRFRLLEPLEHEELLSGMRSLPVRWCAGAVTALLLYFSGDMVGWWPLCWFAFLPLCFACRGAGAPAAFLVAFPVMLAAGVSQTLWLLDMPGSPWGLWFVAALLPALGFFTVELPFCISRLPWFVRPLILAATLIGYYALLPAQAGMLLPLGGFIDSEFTRFAYAKLGLATFAGIFAALAWLAAELYLRKGEGERQLQGWAGLLVAGLLVLGGCIDGLGVMLAAKPSYAGDVTRVYLVPTQAAMETETLRMLGPRNKGGVVLWGVLTPRDDAEAAVLLASAGRVSEQRSCTVAVVVARERYSRGYLFVKSLTPQKTKQWDGAPGEVDGEPLVIEGPGVLSLQPALVPPIVGTVHHDLQLCTTARKPVHAAQQAYWLREQRRGAFIRQARQVCVWPGGGAVLAHDGQVVARSHGEAVASQLTPAPALGESMGKPRLMVMEKILGFVAPTLTAMLVVLSLVAWAKRRYRARRDAPPDIAIEEVYDGQ